MQQSSQASLACCGKDGVGIKCYWVMNDKDSMLLQTKAARQDPSILSHVGSKCRRVSTTYTWITRLGVKIHHQDRFLPPLRCCRLGASSQHHLAPGSADLLLRLTVLAFIPGCADSRCALGLTIAFGQHSRLCSARVQLSQQRGEHKPVGCLLLIMAVHCALFLLRGAHTHNRHNSKTSSRTPV